MFLRQCPFCENVNPPNSKFCNACGVRLHAALCPHCGAVNVVNAAACVNCAADLVETLETAVCPHCGAANDPAAMVCAKCAADLRLEPVQAAGEAAVQTRATPAIAGEPAEPAVKYPAHGIGSSPVVATFDDEEPAIAFSVHFDRDHSVKIDKRYDPDSVHHLGVHEVEVAPSVAHARAAVAPALTHETALIAHATERFVHSIPSVHLPIVEPPVPAATRSRLYAAFFGGAVLATLAASAYYLYREHSMAQMSSMIGSGQEVRASSERPSGGAARGEVPRAVAPSGAVATAPAVAAPSEARGDTQPASRCSDAVVALGLCTPESTTPRRQ